MPEVVAASREGRLLEVFGAGTAAVVCPVREVVFYQGSSIDVPTGGGAGPVASLALAAPLGRALRAYASVLIMRAACHYGALREEYL